MPEMKLRKRLALSLLCAVVAWLIFFRPAAYHMFRGIPAAARPERIPAREMIAGDHLQLLYHFWLAADMLAGHTPLFHNLYEFNSGDDEARFQPEAYYAPFSLVYAAFAALGGMAFGWNMASLASLMFGFFFAWRLAARYVRNEFAAAVAALPCLVFPYRLIALAGGSPTGFAIIWAPALMLGLDMALRSEKPSGSVLAGFALLMACFTDTHVFYFSMLLAPAWCVVALAARADFDWSRFMPYARAAAILSPIILFLIPAALYSVWQAQSIAASAMSGGRSVREVLLCSPMARGFFSREFLGVSEQVYIGLVPAVVLAAGWCVALGFTVFRPREQARRFISLTLLVLCAAMAAALSLGPRGPFKGVLFDFARKAVPMYEMIRQPAKIFSLMPALLTVGLAMCFREMFRKESRVAGMILALIGLAMAADYKSRVSPTICLLDSARPAYAQVVADSSWETNAAPAAADMAAAGTNRIIYPAPIMTNAPPRALAAPLWPGDSHWTSLSQYYSALYRVRMVNGYSPKPTLDYFENVFKRFESVNSGWLSGGQLDALSGIGVRHIVVHEDRFPEKVSPFPVCFALKRLLNNPRLELAIRDKEIWCFRILAAPVQRPDPVPAWDVFFPARRWEIERCATEGGIAAATDSASDGRYLVLEQPGSWVATPSVELFPGGAMRWMVRLRGQGTVRVSVNTIGTRLVSADWNAASDEWTWMELQAGDLPDSIRAEFKAEALSGRVQLDTALLTAGRRIWLEPGQVAEMPAAVFFHAGYIDYPSGDVVFRAARDPEGPILYGPKLPIAPGRYRIDFICASDAPAGVALGKINIRFNEKETPDWSDVLAGKAASIEFDHPSNLPMSMAFVYSRNADMRVVKIRLVRLR